ncbi:hypothetical protein Tco_0150958 [Tanacetum coccineum]
MLVTGSGSDCNHRLSYDMQGLMVVVCWPQIISLNGSVSSADGAVAGAKATTTGISSEHTQVTVQWVTASSRRRLILSNISHQSACYDWNITLAKIGACSAPQGQALIPGRVLVTPGSVVVTPGSVVVTTGSVVVTPGSVVVTTGSILVTPGSVG